MKDDGVVSTNDMLYPSIDRPLLSLAPMMEYTDVFFRQLCRILSRKTVLYTEMVVDGTIIHNAHIERELYLPDSQQPCVLQLGGSNPETLGQAAKVADAYGYDEINLNCGCPSDRVAGKGCFGAAMMKDPELVARCMEAIQANSSVECTVKCRLGVDSFDSYAFVSHFVHVVSTQSRVRHFIIHARKCHLKGLNPSQNRSVPPLHHSWVYALKRDFPHLSFSLNGGIRSLSEAKRALDNSAEHPLAGVMIGRGIQTNPVGVLAGADTFIFGEATDPTSTRRELLHRYAEQCDTIVAEMVARGLEPPKLRVAAKPLGPVFWGLPGNKQWRFELERILRAGEVASMRELVDAVIEMVPATALDAEMAPPSEPKEGPELLLEEWPARVPTEQLVAYRPGDEVSAANVCAPKMQMDNLSAATSQSGASLLQQDVGSSVGSREDGAQGVKLGQGADDIAALGDWLFEEETSDGQSGTAVQSESTGLDDASSSDCTAGPAQGDDPQAQQRKALGLGADAAVQVASQPAMPASTQGKGSIGDGGTLESVDWDAVVDVMLAVGSEDGSACTGYRNQ